MKRLYMVLLAIVVLLGFVAAAAGAQPMSPSGRPATCARQEHAGERDRMSSR